MFSYPLVCIIGIFVYSVPMVSAATARTIAVPGPFVGSLKIYRAFFYTLDVTTIVRNKRNLRITSAGNMEFYIMAANTLFTDPYVGYAKTLAVAYQFNGQLPRLVVAIENQELSADNTASSKYYAVSDVKIYGAYYGPTDVTAAVATLAQAGTFNIQASNSLFGNTWSGNTKLLAIFYQNPAGDDKLAVVGPGSYVNMKT